MSEYFTEPDTSLVACKKQTGVRYANIVSSGSLSISELAESGEDFSEAVRNPRYYEGDIIVSIPEFKNEYDIIMNDVLEKMGMTDAFSSADADFNGVMRPTDDDFYQICLGCDRAERAAVDAVTALNTFCFVDLAETVFIIRDGIYRTCLLARTFQMDNRTIWAGFRTHTALFALCRVDVHSVFARMNCAEFTGVQTCLAQTESAVIRYGICRNRAVVAGRLEHLNNVLRSTQRIRVFTDRKTDPSTGDFTLLIDTAAILRFRSRDQLISQFIHRLLIQIIIPCETADFLHDLMLKLDNTFIIRRYHIFLLSSDKFQQLQ